MTSRAMVVLASVAGVAACMSGGAAQAELLYATSGTTLARFDSTTLGTVTTVPVTGLQGGETLVGIDLRPADGLLYGVGSTSRLYTINPLTGVASQVGAGTFSTPLNGTAFATDFNPSADRIRQMSNTEQNLRLNPITGGIAAVDTSITPAGNIVAAAYSTNNAGTLNTTLYGIDSAAGTLVGFNSPNLGQQVTIGSLGLGTNLNEAIGFDISGLTAGNYATITTGGISRLYSINLGTGAATLMGQIGIGSTPYLGLTAATPGVPVPEPASLAVLGLGAAALLGRRRAR